MLKKISLLLLLLLGLSNANLNAQNYDPCEPTWVAEFQTQLISMGFSCLESAGPFTCVEEVLAYAETTCPVPGVIILLPNDSTFCDPLEVSNLQAQLIDAGYDCLVGAGPFACVSDVFDFAELNCTTPVDSNWVGNCDSAAVVALQEELILEGYDCLVGAGPFACTNDVIQYLNDNGCWGDTTWQVDSCDPAVVAQLQEALIADGYDCLVGAGPFACENDVIVYAINNCQPPVDSNWVNLPDCFLNISATITTFQEFLQFLVANCDSVLVPACFLAAPQFDTDEEFFAWISENCPDDFNQITPTGNNSELMNMYSVTRVVSSTKQPLAQAANVTLTPNPTTSTFTVQLSGNTNMERIELLDLNGRLVLVNQNVQANTAIIALDGLPQGLYVVKVYDQNGRVSTQKGVKQ